MSAAGFEKRRVQRTLACLRRVALLCTVVVAAQVLTASAAGALRASALCERGWRANALALMNSLVPCPPPAPSPLRARAQIFTQTLDLFATLCRQRSWPVIRLDGSTAPGKRQKLVDQFNDPARDEFVFLLSSKAGGCGLNLIGGSRLILFDPDWNPATDLQAAARVWRDGQRKKVFVYRFLAAGSLEEKVFQRQLSKKGLQTIVVEEQDEATSLSTDELRNLFQYEGGNTPSDTHDTLRCTRCLKPELADGESDDEISGRKDVSAAARSTLTSHAGERAQAAASAAASRAAASAAAAAAAEESALSAAAALVSAARGAPAALPMAAVAAAAARPARAASSMAPFQALQACR